MSRWTPFTESLGIQHPIALAPMGGSAGGALAAAVSNGGGLGLVGGGRGDLDWLDRELAIVANRTDRPWGVGFLAWSIEADAIKRALDYGPKAVMLSFGDPASLAPPVLRAGAALMVQVTDLGEARRALDVGADVIVAQGSEAIDLITAVLPAADLVALLAAEAEEALGRAGRPPGMCL